MKKDGTPMMQPIHRRDAVSGVWTEHDAALGRAADINGLIV